MIGSYLVCLIKYFTIKEKGVESMTRMTFYTDKEKGFALPASLPDNDMGDTYSLEDICCKLAPFEDAEEQGLLVIFPCKVGDIFYSIFKSHGIEDLGERKCIGFTDKAILSEFGGIYNFEQIGKTVFLTQEEAEAALKSNL